MDTAKVCEMVRGECLFQCVPDGLERLQEDDVAPLRMLVVGCEGSYTKHVIGMLRDVSFDGKDVGYVEGGVRSQVEQFTLEHVGDEEASCSSDAAAGSGEEASANEESCSMEDKWTQEKYGGPRAVRVDALCVEGYLVSSDARRPVAELWEDHFGTESGPDVVIVCMSYLCRDTDNRTLVQTWLRLVQQLHEATVADPPLALLCITYASAVTFAGFRKLRSKYRSDEDMGPCLRGGLMLPLGVAPDADTDDIVGYADAYRHALRQRDEFLCVLWRVAAQGKSSCRPSIVQLVGTSALKAAMDVAQPSPVSATEAQPSPVSATEAQPSPAKQAKTGAPTEAQEQDSSKHSEAMMSEGSQSKSKPKKGWFARLKEKAAARRAKRKKQEKRGRKKQEKRGGCR